MSQGLSDTAILDLYKGTMADLAGRLDLFRQLMAQVSETKPLRHNQDHCEFAMLQLRFVSELMALGVMIAHSRGAWPGSLTEKDWQADKIMTGVTNAFPHGFPIQITQEPAEPVAQRTLNLPGFLTMYRNAADALHIGSLKSHRRGSKKDFNVPDTWAWHNSVVSLLAHHAIVLPHENRALACRMFVFGQDTDVEVHFAKLDARRRFPV